MANNRLYIVCNKCNDFFALLKYYPRGGFIGGNQGWYSNYSDHEEFNKWTELHEKHAAKLDINGGEYFTFVTEQDSRVKLYDFKNRKIILNGIADTTADVS